jgi:hypothetical protein
MPIPLAFQHYLIPLRSQKKNPRRKKNPRYGVLVDPDR